MLVQSMATLLICWYGISTSISGAFSQPAREKIMSDLANGYRVFKWVDASISPDSILLNSHRSMALAPRKSISLDWFSYVDKNPVDFAIYLSEIKTNKISSLLLLGNNPKNTGIYHAFSGCLKGDPIGPGYGHIATRNPYNRGTEYQAWIYPFDSYLLPDCVSYN